MTYTILVVHHKNHYLIKNCVVFVSFLDYKFCIFYFFLWLNCWYAFILTPYFFVNLFETCVWKENHDVGKKKLIRKGRLLHRKIIMHVNDYLCFLLRMSMIFWSKNILFKKKMKNFWTDMDMNLIIIFIALS